MSTESPGITDDATDGLLDVVVVGGSQAALAIAWHLTQQSLRFVVLDAAPEVGHVWRSRRDSLKLRRGEQPLGIGVGGMTRQTTNLSRGPGAVQAF